MGMMPEDRTRRWNRIFRRYGIAGDPEPEIEKTAEEDALPNPLRKAAEEALRPDRARRANEREKRR